MKIVTVVGARPQFIKASAMSRAIRKHNRDAVEKIDELILHTGQHYDKKMSDVFFSELEIPAPSFNLGIVEKNHGAMTGRMLVEIESVLLVEKPDLLLVYGDTNSTLAGALAATKLHIPIAHVEAGLRSFNMLMPEEVNRILTDRVSDYLFCPTDTAIDNLAQEGVTHGVYKVGDVMYDVTKFCSEKARQKHSLESWSITERKYVLCTIHRAENTDKKEKLKAIFSGLGEIAAEVPVVLPLHPRTRKYLEDYELTHLLTPLNILAPVSYLEMLSLQSQAALIITDSGGVQKEAFFHQVPCVTVRDETEWVETIEIGINTLCPANREQLVDLVFDKMLLQMNMSEQTVCNQQPYGDGRAAEKILSHLLGLI